MTDRHSAAFFCDREDTIERVYRQEHRQQIEGFCDVYPVIVGAHNLEEHLPRLGGVEVVFSTWGMPRLTGTHLVALPKLKAVFYAAGSVKAFALPLLERDILVVSAWAANAVPVAEFTTAQILLANKGYFRNIRDCATPSGRRRASAGPGNVDATVALLGAGMVGRKVIELLKPFRIHVLVYDPFLSGGDARALGVEQVDLPKAFQRAMVVSNHLADVPETRNLLGREHFEALREGAVFINTGRGATIEEAALAAVLRHRRDLTALLDVTFPEPPLPDSPLYGLPNVVLSSHIAGAIGNEVVRLSEMVIEEFEAWRAGEPLRYAVSAEMLERMA